MLCVAALGIMVKSVAATVSPHGAPAAFTLGVLVLVIAVKVALFRTVLRVADDVGSRALAADAWHHRADVVTSGAAFVGISAALIGGPGWEWCDGAAGAVASIIVFLNGLHILRPALHELMDGAPDVQLLERVFVAARSVTGVRLIEHLKARKLGTHYLVDLHAQADPAMSLDEAHMLSGRIKTAIREAVPAVQDVLVHMEPFYQVPRRCPSRRRDAPLEQRVAAELGRLARPRRVALPRRGVGRPRFAGAARPAASRTRASTDAS